MPAHAKAGPVGGGAKYVLDVTVYQVGGRAAYGAEHVMMMALVAQLVTEFPVFQQHPAYLVGFHQQAKPSIHRGPANAGQCGAQILSRKGTSLGRDGADDQAPGLSIPVTLPGQLGNYVVHHGRGDRGGMVVTSVFEISGNQVILRITDINTC